MDDTDMIRRGDAIAAIPNGWRGQPHLSNMDYGPNVSVQAIAAIRALPAISPQEPPSPGVTAGATGVESDADFLRDAGIDGVKWAAGFKAVAERLGHHGMDEGWLIGWFCNAIMAGYDEAERRSAQAATPAPVVPAEGLDALAMGIAIEMEVHASLGTTTKAKADAILAALRSAGEGE